MRKTKLRMKHFKASRRGLPAMAFKDSWVRLLAFVLLLALGFASSAGQSGVLIPSPGEKPDPKILSLAEMSVDILIDNQHATVRIVQIFDNHTPTTLEGKYIFGLSPSASVSDFAVWDDNLRIPGVMMEKRRANQIYDSIKQRRIDPGILQSTDASEGSTGFSARIFPINAYGTKRLEMEYTEELAIDDMTSSFTLPLKPAFGSVQSVGKCDLRVRVVSGPPIEILARENPAFPLRILQSDANTFEADFHAENLELTQDFDLAYKISVPQSTLSVITHRSPERITAYDLRDPRLANANPDGYFQARALFAPANNEPHPPMRFVIMLDTSLSMYGHKLARAVEAAEYFLTRLRDIDEFNLILFSDKAAAFSPQFVAATAEEKQRAMEFVKNSSIGGGTDIRMALRAGLLHARPRSGANASIILISDTEPTLGSVSTNEIVKPLERSGTRVLTFNLGAAPNDGLLDEISKRTGGFSERVLETEDILFKLRSFFERAKAPRISDLRLSTPGQSGLYEIYQSSDSSFPGSGVSFIGRYRTPGDRPLSVKAAMGSDAIELSQNVAFHEIESAHAHLPRLWAKARVNALLQEMNRDGEREDFVSEIIWLSEKYKFVTPYTALIAAPRALLRPRLIQPGDPVIRVKTDPSVTEVYAVLPFGETLPLRFIESQGVWETRFLAPPEMADGTYYCRLLLRDKNGNGYEERKSFVIDSRAPKLNGATDKPKYRAGDEIMLTVRADADTSRITARLYGAAPVDIRWSDEAKSSIGSVRVPPDLLPGTYTLTVTAEDFAHNQSRRELQIEVTGR